MKAVCLGAGIVLFAWGGRAAEAATASLTVIHEFGSTNTEFGSLDGSDPVQPPVEGSDGNFYGTTFEGGADGNGTVYQLTPQGTLTTLYNFQGYDGIGPRGQLVETNHLFYGTTQQGGINVTATNLCCGTVFSITAQGTLTTVYNFAGIDGQTADSGLVPGGGGFFYGTTYGGGTVGTPYNGTNTDSYGDIVNNPPGTAYQITLGGALTTLHSFGGADGANPGKEAIVGLDGNLYGTTLFGGAFDHGTVYAISSAGTFTTLYSFADGTDGAHPKAHLTQGPDGAFYGTTLDGGGKAGQKWCSVDGCGTVFKITAQGTLTTLHDFTGDPEPAHPGSLTLGPDGNFYGTSFAGGTNHEGTVFSITPAGAVTILYQFDVLHGSEPIAGLTLASDGSYYGATTAGGAHGAGTLFRVVVDTNCTVTLKATSISLTAKGGAKTISVSASSDCAWSAETTNDFILITGSDSGVGDGTVDFTVLGNTNTVPLSGTIDVHGQMFTVNQAAGGCTCKLSPKVGKLKSTGGAATVKVTPTLPDCTWTAVSNDPFLTITSGASGEGKGAVGYTVAANPTSNVLTGSLTVAGQTFTVIQAGTK